MHLQAYRFFLFSSVQPGSNPWGPRLQAEHLTAGGHKYCVLQRASQDSFSLWGLVNLWLQQRDTWVDNSSWAGLEASTWEGPWKDPVRPGEED